jgi:exoribonuclease R
MYIWRISMEDRVLEILSKGDMALTIPEIETELGLNSVDELKELLKVLHVLEEEYKVYRTKKDKYMLFNNSNLKVGKLLATKKGYGFVDIEGDEDVFVAPIPSVATITLDEDNKTNLKNYSNLKKKKIIKKKRKKIRKL